LTQNIIIKILILFIGFRGEFTSKLLPIRSIDDDVHYMHHSYHGLSYFSEFAYHLVDVIP